MGYLFPLWVWGYVGSPLGYRGSAIMVVDMQDSDHILFDPEIASQELLDGEEVLFSAANFSLTAISNP